ncbi:alpha/beta hydrolase [Sphingomonas solaris]|uniref:Alpha/beta hydrolase n=1 Tax=Alterirhizorhabdus solaris TaxID=2529389 RepID=A0A558R9E4_9SPHN|nr:alpha/beta hydrolase [Sphingomonas solaris]TVV76010.1 alpha/beta hydrolase [Sphingomonas solaris]
MKGRTITLGLAALPIGAAALLGGLYRRSPPLALNALNDLVPGDGGVRRVATAVPFADGIALDVWAAGTGGAPKPVLIFYYGGAWASGRRRDYAFVARAYAARGFVVVLPDYRKVPGVHFPAFVEDGAAAVRWTHDTIARFDGDPARIVLAGHSAGAYIAVMLALDRRYLAAAGVDPGVVRAAAGLAGPYDFHPFTSPRAQVAMGRAPDPRQTQPITFARRDAPPLWLATGTADIEVHPENALSLAAHQRAAGSTTTVLRQYPGRRHNDLVMAIAKPFRRRAPVLGESIAFFRAHLALL